MEARRPECARARERKEHDRTTPARTAAAEPHRVRATARRLRQASDEPSPAFLRRSRRRSPARLARRDEARACRYRPDVEHLEALDIANCAIDERLLEL